jgi:hypothetical protein
MGLCDYRKRWSGGLESFSSGIKEGVSAPSPGKTKAKSKFKM